mgnify:CR=1 FL=1|jgi:hypothetical protein
MNTKYIARALILTRKEAAELLGISTATITKWVLESRLKAYRVSDSANLLYLYERRLSGCFVRIVGRVPSYKRQRAKS